MAQRTTRIGSGEHLWSALVAFGLVALILCIGRVVAIHLERKTLGATACRWFPLKNQGLAFQKATVARDDVLPLYGSSEMHTESINDKAGEFFCGAPTGFQVSPVGKAGTTSVIILQKVAALSSSLENKKVAISFSPTWFFTGVNPAFYEGNFSAQTAHEAIVGSRLSFRLKSDIASRLLEFPKTSSQSALLRSELELFANGNFMHRRAIDLLWPMAQMQRLVFSLQDHFESLSFLRKTRPVATRFRSEELDWEALIHNAEQTHVPLSEKAAGRSPDYSAMRAGGDAGFVARIETAREWADMELLLRALHEVHAEPLLLSMPINARVYNDAGISHPAGKAYYEKFRALAARYNFKAVTFEDHDGDPNFLYGSGAHLSTAGWMYYNRALDNFYHSRKIDG